MAKSTWQLSQLSRLGCPMSCWRWRQLGQTAYSGPQPGGMFTALAGRGTTVQRRGGLYRISRNGRSTGTGWAFTSRTTSTVATRRTRYQPPRRNRQLTSAWSRAHCFIAFPPCGRLDGEYNVPTCDRNDCDGDRVASVTGDTTA